MWQCLCAHVLPDQLVAHVALPTATIMLKHQLCPFYASAPVGGELVQKWAVHMQWLTAAMKVILLVSLGSIIVIFALKEGRFERPGHFFVLNRAFTITQVRPPSEFMATSTACRISVFIAC